MIALILNRNGTRRKLYQRRTLSFTCHKQDYVGLHECKGGIASLIKYANQLKLEVLGSHLLEKQQENQSILIHINCQRKVGNIMRKRKRAGDCVAEVAST